MPDEEAGADGVRPVRTTTGLTDLQAESGPEPLQGVALNVLVERAEQLATYQSSGETILLAYRMAKQAYELEKKHAMLLARNAFLAALITNDIHGKAAYARNGLNAARSATSQALASPAEVAYYQAVNFGFVLQAKGLAAVNKLSELEGLLEQASALPDLDHGGAQRALGMLYLRAPAWPTGVGDLDQALENLAAVCTRYPAFPLNQICYAEALIENGQPAQAIERLDLAKSLLTAEEWGGFQSVWQAEIDKLSSQIE